MARPPREQRSLARNLARTTFVAVAVAVVVIGVFALAGVYGVTSTQIESGHSVYAGIMGAEIAARFESSREALDELDLVSADGEVDRLAMSRNFAASGDFFDRVLLAGLDGRVAVGYPLFLTASDISGEAFFRPDESTSTTRFTYIASDEPAVRPTVWATRLVSQPAVGTFVTMGRVRTEFLWVVLDQVSGPLRSTAVVDSSSRVIAEGREGPSISFDGARFEADEPGGTRGVLLANSDDLGAMRGHWFSLEALPGLDWRVAVAEPRMAQMERTYAALAPAGFATLVFGLLAVGLAWFGARRLVAPVREIGRRAEQASRGAYVRPISVRRSDEVGSLAEGFNSLALRLNALHDVSRLLAGVTEPEEVADQVVDALHHIVRWDSLAFYVLDTRRTRLVLGRAEGDISVPASMAMSSRSWLTEMTRAQGPSCFLGVLGGSGKVARSDPAQHSVAIPLSVAGEPVGVVILCREAREFTDAELEMLSTLGAQAAVALRTARLFEVETQSRREAEVLRAVAEQLANPQDLGTALHDASAMAVSLLGARRGGIGLVQPSLFDLSEDDEVFGVWLRLWAALAPDDESRMQPMLVTDAASRAGVADLIGDIEVTTVLVAPLVSGASFRGVLGFAFGPGDEEPGTHHVALAGTIAKQLVLALENAFLFRQARERAANLETIFRITQAVSSSLQITVVLNRVLDVVQKIFSADAVSLMTYDPKRRTIVTAMARGLVSAEMLHLERAPGEDIPGSVFEARKPMIFGALMRQDWPLARMGSAQGLRSLVCVPLLARGRSIGVLTVFSTEPSAFGEDDVELLRTFASQAALAIDTAELFGREHTVASVLQKSIMPDKLPELPGVESASVYIAAGTEGDIGGDYFDIFSTSDRRIVLVMGDVAGKGVLAATKTSMIRYSVRAFVTAGMSASECLAEVNRTLTESGDATDIVTLWVGFLDIGSGVLDYANGGHPPALFMRAKSGEVKSLGPTGPLLGAAAHAPFGQERVKAAAGDFLLLYTDGVSEARRGGRFFGEGRVRRTLEAGGPPSAVTERLIAEVNRFTSGSLRDDIAILAVRLLDGDVG